MLKGHGVGMQSISGDESLHLEFFDSSSLLNPAAAKKGGDDPIFAWFKRYLSAKEEGKDAINGTLGSLLLDNGELALNQVVMDSLRNQKGYDMAGYAPLRGIPSFRELAIDLALGPHRDDIPAEMMSMTTPGGCGALYASARNFADPGSKVLLRDLHWSPYQTILAENNLSSHTYPLWGSGLELAVALEELVSTQSRVLSWLNDPAHNPTGLTLTSEERKQTLNCFIASARSNPSIGHTLLIDAAYHLYASEPFGWAQTLSQVEEWPHNLLILFAISCSKSHTIYGLRTGALVCLHPSEEFLSRVEGVLLHTGRGTWSAPPRLPQIALAEIHAQMKDEWEDQKDTLKALLKRRRVAFNSALEQVGVRPLPNHDGYFAFIECEDSVAVCESCAEENVFLVPLSGGIRVGICAIPASRMKRVASALANALGE